MGSSSSSSRKTYKNAHENDLEVLAKKVKLLQREIYEMMAEREEEGRAYEQDMAVFTMKEAEWKRERKSLRGEVKRLRKVLQEKEEKMKEMEGEILMADEKIEKKWQVWEANVLVEHIKEERAARDETVERWKKLYLAIKSELDDLLQRTCQGGLYVKEEVMEEMEKELKEKEETIEVLNARVVLMEKEAKRKGRELDILRQSLRIVCNKKSKKPSKCISWNHCQQLYHSS